MFLLTQSNDTFSGFALVCVARIELTKQICWKIYGRTNQRNEMSMQVIALARWHICVDIQ